MTDNIEIVERAFAAYLKQDLETAQQLYGADFVFTSPQDDHIDRAAFFERCFPTSSRVRSQQLLHVVAADEHNVFVTYQYELLAGGTFRNTELITVRDGQLVETQVFFGGNALPARSTSG
ncbi:MAG: nuclear transport factor 2 family protein [Nakamurella sp.]